MMSYMTGATWTPMPPARRNGRPDVDRLGLAESPVVFVSKIILALIAIVVAVVLIAAASPAVTTPLAIVLGTGLTASAAVVAADRWHAARPRHRGASLPGATQGGRAPHGPVRPRDDEDAIPMSYS